MSRKLFPEAAGAVCLALLVFLGPACSRRKPPADTGAGKSAAESQRSAAAPDADKEIAGEIFGVPVPAGNYYFAKQVHSTFQGPGEKEMTPEQKEKFIWHNLILHYEATRRGIAPTADEMKQWIDSVFQALDLKIKPSENSAAYKSWVETTLKSNVEFFENQMRYLATIEKLRREVVPDMTVQVSDEEIRKEFSNVENHVGGEYLLFDKKEEAQAFYEAHQSEKEWEAYKKDHADAIRPFALITEQAIIDLWGVPQEQIDAFHALPLGTVGEPLPFGQKWGVFRLLQKREADPSKLDDKLKEDYRKRVEMKKKFAARDEWLEHIDERANLKVYLKPQAAEAAQNSAAAPSAGTAS